MRNLGKRGLHCREIYGRGAMDQRSPLSLIASLVHSSSPLTFGWGSKQRLWSSLRVASYKSKLILPGQCWCLQVDGGSCLRSSARTYWNSVTFELVTVTHQNCDELHRDDTWNRWQVEMNQWSSEMWNLRLYVFTLCCIRSSCLISITFKVWLFFGFGGHISTGPCHWPLDGSP